MSGPEAPLQTQRLLRPAALLYFYRRRLRAHGTEELLAGIGIAAAVALVLAAGIAQQSIAGSTRTALRAVIGPADLQLRSRGPEGFPEKTLERVEALPGVQRAAPLLERTVTLNGPGGHASTAYLAGTDVSLGVLDGLGRTLPLAALKQGTISLSTSSAHALGVSANEQVDVLVGGARRALPVGAVLGSEAVGTLAGQRVAVMPLATMQTLLGEPGRVSRILVQSRPGQQARVRSELRRIAGPGLAVASSEQDIALLSQALRPSSQASTLFAVIGALLGFMLAFNAILMTVPERRRMLADLRLSGTRRSAIVQLTLFQGLCLGALASLVGVAAGYVLSRWVFHVSTGYLAEAFALSGATVVPAGLVVMTAVAGTVVTCLASALPLADLRRGRPRDAVYLAPAQTQALSARALAALGGAASVLLVLTAVLYAAAPSLALVATIALALATVLAAPVVFAGVLWCAQRVSEHAPRLSTLALALSGIRGTSLRPVALVATGAVALFGSVALGGARSNLLSGIGSFAAAYSKDAPVWVGEPGDNQAVGQLRRAETVAARLRSVPGVRSVAVFDGAFMTLGQRRVWVIARPPGGARSVLSNQMSGGASAAARAEGELQNGAALVSGQIASERHTRIGAQIALATPSGPLRLRLAGLTSNLAWIPGVVLLGEQTFARGWGADSHSAIALTPAAGVPTAVAELRVRHALAGSGLEVLSAQERQRRIDGLTGEGLSQLGVISTLLVAAAILALAAALTSSIHRRRAGLAGLRLAGAPPGRLRRILFVEGALMLGAGCVTGALAGLFGQFVIDAYLRHVTAFPVTGAAGSARPIVIFAVVLAAAALVVAVPVWLASRVPPSLALAEE